MSLNYGLVAGYHFNNDATDWTGNENDGTDNNVTFVDDKNGNPNSAGSFNGTSSYISFSGSFTGNKLTISKWLKYTDSTTLMIPLKLRSGTGNVLNIYLNSTGDLQLLSEDTGDNNLAGYFSNSTLYDGNWNHFSAVLDFDNNTIDFYLNGVLQTTTYLGQAATTGYSYTGTSYIGAEQDFTRRYYNGDIDELRIYNRALTQYEISQLYYGYDTEDNQVGTLNEGLVAGYHMEDTSDWSGNGNTLTYNGTTPTTDKNGVADKARSFDGTSDYIDTNVPSNDLNSFTISAWANVNDNDFNVNGLYTLNGGADGASSGMTLYFDSNNNYFSLKYDGNTDTDIASMTPNQWYYTTTTYNSNTNEIKVYINGNHVHTTNFDFSLNSDNIIFGTDINGTFSARFFDGDIDEPRIYNRALHPIEVLMLYKGYDSEQSSQNTLTEGLVYGSHFDSGTATDYSGNGNDGTVNGAQPTTDKDGVSSQALDFDGTNDYVDLGDNYEGYDKFTCCAHINFDAGAVGDNEDVITKAEVFALRKDSSERVRVYIHNGTSYINSQGSTTMSSGTWYHVLLEYTGSEVIPYLNSVADSSGASVSTMNSNTTNALIGNLESSSTYFTGKIDEPRIYNRNLFQDEVIELTYGYDNPTMLAEADSVSPEPVTSPVLLFNFGGL